MTEDERIIERYKNALFDDYYTYLDVIKQINSSIPDFAEGMGFSLIDSIYFEYPEFCRKFLQHLRKNLEKNNNLSEQSVIYQIFEQMMLEKILDNINKTSYINDDFDGLDYI